MRLERRNPLATAVGVGSLIAFSSAPAILYSLSALDTFQVLTLSFFVAAIAALCWAALRRQTARHVDVKWSITSFLGIFLYHSLLLYSFKLIEPSFVNLINYMWPIILSVMLFCRKPSAFGIYRRTAGLALVLIGYTVLISPTVGNLTSAATLGVALAFFAALSWATYSFIATKFINPTAASTALAFSMASLASLGVSLVFEGPWQPTTLAEMATIALLGAGPLGLALVGWSFSLALGHARTLVYLAFLLPISSQAILIASGFATLSVELAIAATLVTTGTIAVSINQTSQ